MRRVIEFSADEWAQVERDLRAADPPSLDDVGYQCARTGRDLSAEEVATRQSGRA